MPGATSIAAGARMRCRSPWLDAMRIRLSRLSIARRLALAFAVLFTATSYAEDASKTDIGKRLFTAGATPPCAICHTLKNAGAEGAIGPSLDELKPDAERVVKALKTGIGVMPPFPALSDKDVAALAEYVSKAAK